MESITLAVRRQQLRATAVELASWRLREDVVMVMERNSYVRTLTEAIGPSYYFLRT